jgi:Uncharacterized conserved protein
MGKSFHIKSFQGLFFLTLSFCLLFAAPHAAQAACSSPTGVAGQMKYNADYHVPQYCDNTNWIAMGVAATSTSLSYLTTNTANSTASRGVWGDGTYIYVADGVGGLDVYRFDGTTLTLKATNTTNAIGARNACGDGTYIYVAADGNGLQAYTFDGTTLTYKASDTANAGAAKDVWCDGTYVYVASITKGIAAFTFNGTSFTLIASSTTYSSAAWGVWSDGTYIYAAHSNNSPGAGIAAYTFNGTAFTYLASDSTHSPLAAASWGDGTYIYVADQSGGIDAYSFNGSSLTYLATDTTHSTNAQKVWGDGTYIYVADSTGGGVDVYSFNGTTLTYITSNATNSTDAKGVWSDGTYIYLADNTGGIDAYGKYGSCPYPTKSAGSILYNPDYRTMQYCDGGSWQNMINGNYTAWGVTFDGTNDYLSYTTSFGVDSTQATGSFWFRRNGNNGTQQVLFCAIDSAGSCRYQIDLDASNKIHLKGNGTGGGTLRLDASGFTSIVDTNWHHVMYSFDLANSSNRSIYLDGVAETPTWGTYSNAVIDFTRTGYSVGAFTNGASKFNGDIADFWLDEGTYMDLSAAANRALFRDANGYPVDLGSTGNRPTGSVPDVFFSGASVSTFNTNQASGAAWTLNGALDRASTQPALSCSHNNNFNYLTTNTANTTNGLRVWGDGTYIYVTNNSGGGLDAYTFDGAAFTFKAKASSPTPYNVWGDGTYIYGAAGFNGVRAYTFNGSAFTLVVSDTAHTTNAQHVWGDGTYIYVADWNGGIDAYSFNGSSFTWLASNTTNSTFAQGVWGDGTYIYVADNSGGIDAYTFNGSAFTFIATNTANITNAQKVWGDGTYIYVADSAGGIDAYTFNGTSFTFIASDATNSTNARDVWGDGTYIYVANATGGIAGYSFNGTSFTFKGTDITHSTNAQGVWGDGTYIYVADGSGGIDAYNKGFTMATCTCSSPTGTEGTMLYNSDYSRYQFCDGRAWRSIGK